MMATVKGRLEIKEHPIPNGEPIYEVLDSAGGLVNGLSKAYAVRLTRCWNTYDSRRNALIAIASMAKEHNDPAQTLALIGAMAQTELDKD